MLKYKIKILVPESLIDIDLFAHVEEKELVKEKAEILICRLQNLGLIEKDELNVVKGEVHGLYNYNFKVPCSSATKENQIRKEIESLGFEEKEEDETQGET